MSTPNWSDLDIIEGGPHSLLMAPSHPYSNLSVRRAFIVWMYCGQKNKFKDVCNYYHCLEAMEEKLQAEQRAASRHCEFELFSNPPPKSQYLMDYFPNLYPGTPIKPEHIQKLEAIKNEKCIFKLEGFKEIKQKGVTRTEIMEVSQIIRGYCKSQLIPLRRFLEDYKEYANKCGLVDTVANVAAYIKRKLVQAELETVANYPKTFSFLNSNSDLYTACEESKLGDKIEQSDTNPLENNLKLILGIRSDSPISKGLSNDNIYSEKRYNSCAEFFQSFTNHNNSECKSVLSLPGYDDFHKVFGQEKIKSRSVEFFFREGVTKLF